MLLNYTIILLSVILLFLYILVLLFALDQLIEKRFLEEPETSAPALQPCTAAIKNKDIKTHND